MIVTITRREDQKKFTTQEEINALFRERLREEDNDLPYEYDVEQPVEISYNPTAREWRLTYPDEGQWEPLPESDYLIEFSQ